MPSRRLRPSIALSVSASELLSTATLQLEFLGQRIEAGEIGVARHDERRRAQRRGELEHAAGAAASAGRLSTRYALTRTFGPIPALTAAISARVRL